MKILVGVKRVVDYNVRIQVKPDGSGIATNGVKMSMNPFDEIAIEEALRIKEAGHAAEVIAVTMGPKVAQEQLRTALAMGADRAIHVETDEDIQPLTAARIFKALCDKESPKIVLLGNKCLLQYLVGHKLLLRQALHWTAIRQQLSEKLMRG